MLNCWMLKKHYSYSTIENILSFHTCSTCFKEIAKKGKTKNTSSYLWLNRQINDPYVEKSKLANYRCRSAFKLIEIDDKYKILKPGYIVIDCGAAPGSWSQVAVERVQTNLPNAKGDNGKCGMIISIDRSPIFPIEGATILSRSDFTAEKTKNKLKELLNDELVDVVLSDMAPNATGCKDLNHNAIIQLCYNVLRFSVLFSKTGATCLMKLWDGHESNKLFDDMCRFYKNVRWVKPQASRCDSSEIFLLGREFRGLKSTD